VVGQFEFVTHAAPSIYCLDTNGGPAWNFYRFYRILGSIGAGGMGEVYKGYDAKLERHVALKTLPGNFAHSPERLARLKREAKTLAALNHPNIVTIYDVGQAGDVTYIVMEFLEGMTLRQILSRERLPITKVLHLASQVADGLAKVHAACIFHRDLKPENLMLTKDGLVKILDFGLAKQGIVSNEVSETVTATGSVGLQGTVGYMSPEQASGQDVDYRADQFSFGCILYEMVSGRRAFSRGTAVETLSAIINEDPPAISHQELPQGLSWIIQRCLSKNREDRYESTKSLASDLQRLRDHVNFSAQKAVHASLNKRRQRVVSLLAAVLTLLLPLLVWLNVGGIRNAVFGPTASKRIPSLAVLPLDIFQRIVRKIFLRTA